MPCDLLWECRRNLTISGLFRIYCLGFIVYASSKPPRQFLPKYWLPDFL